MSMYKVRIKLAGCDDSTYVEQTITQSQLEFLSLLEHDSKENSRYGCMPTLSYKIEKTILDDEGSDPVRYGL